MVRSMAYLAESPYNPGVKSFTDAAGIFSDALAFGGVFLCVCMCGLEGAGGEFVCENKRAGSQCDLIQLQS